MALQPLPYFGYITYTRANMLRILIALIFFLPFTATATGTAGFLDRSIWHTPETYYADEMVRIYAALMNTSNADVSGTLNFLVNDKVIGRRTFTLQANEVTAVWYDWKATGGSHSFSATIADTTFSAQNSAQVVAPRVVNASPIIVATTTPPKSSELSQDEATTTPTHSLGETIDTTAEKAQTSLEAVRESLDEKIAVQRARVAGTSTVAEDASFIESGIEQVHDAATPPVVKEAKNVFASAWLFVLNMFRGILSLAISVLDSPLWTAIVLVLFFMLFMKLCERIFRIFGRKSD